MASRAVQAANARYAAVSIEDQRRRGCRIVFEHLWGMEFLREKPTQDVLGFWSLVIVRLDQCVVGLTDRSSGSPHQKPTVIVTNDRFVAGRLSGGCTKDHDHQRLEGSNA